MFRPIWPSLSVNIPVLRKPVRSFGLIFVQVYLSMLGPIRVSPVCPYNLSTHLKSHPFGSFFVFVYAIVTGDNLYPVITWRKQLN
jgi:hypothetical protein